MSQRYNSLSMSKRCFRCQPVTFIVKEFSRRWYKRWPTHVLGKMGVFSSSQPTTTLKKELQRKLNHSRTRSRRRAGDYPKIPIVGRAARGIRGANCVRSKILKNSVRNSTANHSSTPIFVCFNKEKSFPLQCGTSRRQVRPLLAARE